MSAHQCNLTALTIPNGDTVSNAVDTLGDADSLALYAPSALTGTVTVQVEPTATGTSWVDLTSGGADVTLAAGNMLAISPVAFRQVRLQSSVAEGAARAFTFTKQFTVR